MLIAGDIAPTHPHKYTYLRSSFLCARALLFASCVSPAPTYVHVYFLPFFIHAFPPTPSLYIFVFTYISGYTKSLPFLVFLTRLFSNLALILYLTSLLFLPMPIHLPLSVFLLSQHLRVNKKKWKKRIKNLCLSSIQGTLPAI